jgi:exodeoxyribonuclease VII small subunit
VPKNPPAVEKMSFEAALRELETIVRRLESADLSLDDSLGLFERGQALAAHCTALLDAADLRVRKIAPGGELEDFEDSE